MKRVMIDGRNLSLEKGTGVATYARNLSYCLHDLGYQVEVLYGGRAALGQPDFMKEVLFFDSTPAKSSKWLDPLRIATQLIGAPLGYKATKVPITGVVIKDAFNARLPYYDAIYNSPDLFRRASGLFGLFATLYSVHISPKPDLMHWTYPLPLRVKGIPNIYTLHDLVPLRLPYTTLDNKRRYFQLVLKIAKTADHIVTVSESSKSDIVRIFGVAPDRITNTYQTVSIPKEYAEKAECIVREEVEGIFGLQYKGYFIFWGSIEPKKNIARIIEGYLASNIKSPLVIIGAQAWKSEGELRLLKETCGREKIILMGYVPLHLLVSLIKGAKATVFPSLYEGFGLPVLESMLLGTPVITSNRGAIPEIAGDAARMVDPYDSRQIAEAIKEFDRDDELRAHYSVMGLRQAMKFSESMYQQRVSDLYKQFI